MRERTTTYLPIAGLLGAFGVCCGLPVLLSLGLLGGTAGVTLENWTLIGVGVVLAGVGSLRPARRRARRVAGPLPHRPQVVPDLHENIDNSRIGDHR